MISERLALTVVPGAGWRAADVRLVAREAEEAGFEAMFSTEVNSDSMTTAAVIGGATKRLTVGTWVANIYLRHPYLCAKGAELIADDTGGRFVLGLGTSHGPVNDALGVDMTNAPRDLVTYAQAVRDWLAGRGPTTHLPQSPAANTVPIHLAVLGFGAVTRAAEVADGLMPTMWSPERVADSAPYIARGRARSPGRPPPEMTLGLPTFLGEDLDRLRATARENLGLYTRFPFFRRMWRESGFGEEADAMDRYAGAAALSDRLLDSFCLLGPRSRCLERLAEYRAAGVDLPILNPPIGPDAALELVRTFAE
ncbi:LLM class flavin-dependent oxidoreductase [Actinomycetospora lutea]|uniref:LLM class flavin-dependent oxidoreductase n=1 Tax=Actinomycetospora lutea TaxID=663604 RepID=UPI0023656EB3|nr:LLM class flavin-dependent oxidoreductase [Actinomycetospora lutea]MDD7942205.1 LLM class flavin-dependent oxidoreductase [Actinomycetospora lutea]